MASSGTHFIINGAPTVYSGRHHPRRRTIDNADGVVRPCIATHIAGRETKNGAHFHVAPFAFILRQA
jgi:hypothetical protein